MTVLIKQALISCSSSAHHGKIKDILIKDGIIIQIEDLISQNADTIIEQENLHASIGWMDIYAHFADPGQEQKETIVTGANAAAAGGFTDVMVIPNTIPAVSSKSQVEYIRQKSAALPVRIYPIAAVTKNTEGKELAEMYDMHNSGAIAFSDGISGIQDPGVLLKALQYVLALPATIIQLPDDKQISPNGQMNEGVISTRLGLPGRPAISEEIMIARDIELLRYTGSSLHITGVTTAKGLSIIRKAKEEGLQISCSITPAHAWFCDEDLHGYDTNLKLNPPLRTRADMMAVRLAAADGTADCIASHHLPQHWDDKTCEFEYAKFGMTGLESLFAVMNSFERDLHALVEQLTVAPRRIFRIPLPEIKEAAEACITLFNPHSKYTYSNLNTHSKSKNNAFEGKLLRGKIIGIINNKQVIINGI